MKFKTDPTGPTKGNIYEQFNVCIESDGSSAAIEFIKTLRKDLDYGVSKEALINVIDEFLSQAKSGEPLMTIRGWRLSRFKHVIPPQSYMRNGALFNVVDLPNRELVEELRESVLKKVDPDGSRRLMVDDD